MNTVNLTNYDIINHIACYNYKDRVRDKIHSILTILTTNPDDVTLYEIKCLKEDWAEMLDEYISDVHISHLPALFTKK